MATKNRSKSKSRSRRTAAAPAKPRMSVSGVMARNIMLNDLFALNGDRQGKVTKVFRMNHEDDTVASYALGVMTENGRGFITREYGPEDKVMVYQNDTIRNARRRMTRR